MAYNDDGSDGPATVLLTRPRAQSEVFAAELQERFPELEIVITPLLRIVAVGDLPELSAFSGVILSSANALRFTGRGQGQRAYCVGTQTTAAARAAGFDAVRSGGTADELVAALTAAQPSGTLVHLRGKHQRGDIAERLNAAGLMVKSIVLYDQVALAPERAFVSALGRTPLIVPLFSPRSADLFHRAAQPTWGDAVPEKAHLVALSDAVADALPGAWRPSVTLAPTPDRSGMLDGIGRRVYP